MTPYDLAIACSTACIGAFAIRNGSCQCTDVVSTMHEGNPMCDTLVYSSIPRTSYGQALERSVALEPNKWLPMSASIAELQALRNDVFVLVRPPDSRPQFVQVGSDGSARGSGATSIINSDVAQMFMPVEYNYLTTVARSIIRNDSVVDIDLTKG